MGTRLMDRIIEKEYMCDYDYLLDVLNKSHDELFDNLLNKLPDDMLYLFSKYSAVESEITNLIAKKAYDLGYGDGVEINNTLTIKNAI